MAQGTAQPLAAEDEHAAAEPAVARETMNGEPLDLVHLDRHTLGNRDLAREVLGLFARQAEQLRHRLGEEGDPAERARAVHTWKVAEAAETMEAALRGGKAGDASALNAALDEARDFIAMTLDAE
jgi:hypothetical protein